MKRILFALALTTGPALAQGVGPHNLPQVPQMRSPTPQQQETVEQRLGAQIGALVIQNTALQVKVGELQAQINAMAHARPQTRAEPKKSK